MHLKSCPLVRSELRLEPSAFPAPSHRSAVFVSQQRALLRTCSGNLGNSLSLSRLPLGVISTNRLHCSVTPTFATQPQGCENNVPDDGQSGTEDVDTLLDVWTVIRPGHVREKIAIFAAGDERGGGGASTGGSCNRMAAAACVNLTMMAGLSRVAKAKGSWEGKCGAKRRRRSGNDQKVPREPPTHDALQPPHGQTAPEEHKVSVGDMVAYLERRADDQPKPLVAVQRSSASITLSRAPPPVSSEVPDGLCVFDMVARLESQCVRRSLGGVSRSNSLRRTVGRVLLAADQSSTPCTPSSPAAGLCVTGQPISCLQTDQSLVAAPNLLPEASPTAQHPPIQLEGAEPPPGLLFLPVPTPQPTPRCDSGSQSESRRRCGEGTGLVRRSVSASQDFLQLRQRVEQLLAPQPFLWALPHHLLLHILHLLPTASLAALKCTCSYFKVVMETYGVRPIDSLWVSDPRYRDDPCKQCKRRYWRGDVSLCRWHHKPFCQVLPGGPGYWMCCRGNCREAPGCNVGLHDNRWVPAFHSISAPLRRSSNYDN